jgi:hypothetical protein
MAPPHFLCLPPLFRSQHRVERAAGPSDDRIDARLYLSSHRLKLTAFPIHDRIDLGLLLR